MASFANDNKPSYSIFSRPFERKKVIFDISSWKKRRERGPNLRLIQRLVTLLNQHEKLSPLLLRVVANIFTKRSKINGIIMWIMTTDFSEHTPRQTRRVVRFTEPMLLTRSSPRADWRDAKLRGKTLFVVRHFVTLMAGTARACSAVFETCH